MIQTPQRPDNIADVGAHPELCHPAYVDGNLHWGHLTTETAQFYSTIPGGGRAQERRYSAAEDLRLNGIGPLAAHARTSACTLALRSA